VSAQFKSGSYLHIVCHTESRTQAERAFGNRVVGRSFGPKSDETGKWRRMSKEEVHIIYTYNFTV
jgi:hypothetical protein